jgi:hypothetical protein
VIIVPRFVLTLLLLISTLATYASVPDSTAVIESKASRIGINTYTWRTFWQGADSLNNQHFLRYNLGYDLLYNSALPENHFTREDYLANLVHSWRFRPRWLLEEHFSYQNNRASFTEIGSFTEHLYFQPGLISNWEVRPSVFAGLRRDARSLRTDTGPEFGGHVSGNYTSPDNSEVISANAFIGQANLSPRVFQRIIADARYEQKFEANSTLMVRAEYRRNRNEDYLANNVQRIQSDTIAAYLTGTYTVSDKLSFRSLNQLALPKRTFSYRSATETGTPPPGSGYDQFELETIQEVLFQLPKVRANGQIGFRERNRRYSNSRDNIKDLLQNTSFWILNATYLFTDRHSLTSQNQGELLRVDTPSEQNNEDRDEVFYQSKLLFSSRWLPSFRTNFALVGTYKQYVFIKALQSAENYTERSLVYEPGFIWTPGKFSWEAQLQLQANYQVRALLSEQLKNRANRTFNQTHLVRYEANSNLLFQAEFFRRENRLGLLNWERFTESPLDTTTSNTLAVYAKKGFSGKRSSYSFRGGYRFFEQQVKGKAGLSNTGQAPTLIYLHQVTRQHGPEIRYERRTNKGLRLEAGLWMQRLRNFKTYRETNLAFLGTTITSQELAAEQHDWYPYFDVSLHWAFRVWKR